MDFDDDDARSNQDQAQNLENMLDDLGLGDENNLPELSKKDSTIFIVDCSRQINIPLDGQQQSQMKMIFDGYSNFLQRKIIANTGDQVGLILYNVKSQSGSNFKNIHVIHKLGEPTATTIKEANNLHKTFETLTGGFSDEKVTLQHVFWTYSDEIKKLGDGKYYLRLFLFTDDDNPHPIETEHRTQAINQARLLSDKNVQIELFPLRKQKRSLFNVTKFYQQIIAFDPDEINETVLDSSSKILDLKQRLRQKQFKKRTLNRLLMKIGNQTQIGVKLFALYTKAKRLPPKKVDARTNRYLQRITTKLNREGKGIFQAKIGTYYPLGGQKVIFSKEDMNKVKNIEPPGMTLIGFKPKKLIKPYHNLRTSYFLYPDEDHVVGSSQLCDALINELTQRGLVGIAKIVPRNNQQMSFAALFPQKQTYDEETHYQTPPGFNMIILPYADDIVNFVGDKTICKPMQISEELVAVTSLLVNNLTINDFDFRSFENPSLQKFYSHLQALALGQKHVQQRPDLLQPDRQTLKEFEDIINILKETAESDNEYFAKKEEQNTERIDQEAKVKKEEDEDYYNHNKEVQKKTRTKRQNKKSVKKEHDQILIQENQQLKHSTLKRDTKKNVKTPKIHQQQIIEIQEEGNEEKAMVESVQSLIVTGDFDSLKASDLKTYLKYYGLDDKGKKDILINRALVYISQRPNV